MDHKTKMFAAAALFVAGFSATALAQVGSNYAVKTMNFDMWCQETAHLAPARCDKRTPEDEKVFEDYRAQIEHYEVPYLQQQQKDLALGRDILDNDPIDHRLSQDQQAQQQLPTQQPQKPSP